MNSTRMVYFRRGRLTITRLMERLSHADVNNQSLRFYIGTSPEQGNYLCYKIGEGMWSEPVFEDEDPNRG